MEVKSETKENSKETMLTDKAVLNTSQTGETVALAADKQQNNKM